MTTTYKQQLQHKELIMNLKIFSPNFLDFILFSIFVFFFF